MDFDALSWSVAEGYCNDLPIIIRFRQFPDSFPRADYPHRLNIFWSLVSPADSGQPSDVELRQLHDFEDHLLAAVEPDNQAILAIVLTANNQREFVLHTRETDDFIRRLTEMPQEEVRYPIEIHHNEDAIWDYVVRILADIQQ